MIIYPCVYYHVGLYEFFEVSLNLSQVVSQPALLAEIMSTACMTTAGSGYFVNDFWMLYRNNVHGFYQFFQLFIKRDKVRSFHTGQ